MSVAAVPLPDVGFGELRDVTSLRVRASDADRLATVHDLQEAMAQGRLTFDECGERMAAAFASRHVDDLPRLTADLPPMAAPDPGPPGWAQLGRMVLAQVRVSLRGGLRGRFTRQNALRLRDVTQARLGGGSGGRSGPRRILRVALMGVLVLSAIVLSLLLLALAGTAAHELLDIGHGHHGGGYHHGYGYGHHHHHHHDFDDG
jgi:hypothetical protein